MNDEKCMKEEIICDLKSRVEKLEDNDREDYGSMKEISTTLGIVAHTLSKVDNHLDTLSNEAKLTNQRVGNLEKQIDKIKNRDEAQNEIKDEIKIEQIKGKVEITKGKMILYGSIIASIFTFLGIVIPILFSLISNK